MTGYRQTKWLNSRLINNYYPKNIIHCLTNYFMARLVLYVHVHKIEFGIKCICFFSPALWNGIEKKHYNATLVYRYYWFRSNCDESLFYSVLSLESPLIRAAAAMVSRAVHFDNKWNKLSFPCFDWNSLYNHLERKLKMVKFYSKRTMNEWWKHQWYAICWGWKQN